MPILMILIFDIFCLEFQTLPRLRFNKEGSLLAVNTAENGIKILANADGYRILRAIENRPFDGSSRLSMDPAAIKVTFL